MKRILLFAFAFLFAMASMAQNRAMLIQESFDGSSIPTGWSIIGQTNNWSVSATQNAGGTANEMKLDWSPQFNGMTRLVTPAVDLTGINSVVFAFKHALDNYQGTNSIGIATSSDGGTTWHEGWTQGYNSSGSWAVSQEITTADMGQASVHFCIYFNGSSYNINDWYFDDITVFTLENLDLGIASSSVPGFVGSGNTPLDIEVFNYGSTTVTSVEATYQIEGEAPVTETFNVNIASLQNATLNFTEVPSFIPGSYVIDYTINKVNGVDDDVLDNNQYTSNVSVAIAAVDKIPMIEHFSSSTCGPCVSVNTTMHNFCNNNAGRFTYTKYQMNWPGNGDPYYTQEGGVRRDYYNVNAVPQCFLDGEDQGYAAVQQSVFDQHALRAAFMDVKGSFNVDGTTINVKADVMPYIDADARVFVTVNEKTTHNNVGSNGETEFHHVFMKMLTNTQGDAISFNATEVQHLEFTQNMSGTHVEEMSDLEVSIWVQVYATHEVLNSHFAYDYTDEHPYPVQNLTMVASKDRDYTLTASWEAPENGTPIGYDVYLNGEVVENNTTETSYSFTSVEGSYEVVGVVAKYAEDKSSVLSVVSTPDGPQDLGLVPTTTSIVLDPENAGAEVRVTNTNDLTQAPIVINSIEEVNDEGRQYLTITCADLPLTLNYAEDFLFIIEPYLEVKGVAETSVVLSSDAGDLTFAVTVDGELLNVSEVSSETKLYPNPTTKHFTVEGANIEKVEVYNLVGQMVCEKQGKMIRFDVANWNKGMYLVNIIDQNGSVETKKLMVK